MNFRNFKARNLEVRFNDEHRSSMDRVESLPLLRRWRFPRVSGLALLIAGVLSSWFIPTWGRHIALASVALIIVAPRSLGLRAISFHHVSGSNSGSQTSSCCSNTTRTSMPIHTSSNRQWTMLVVSRSPRCSASSTIAMT